MSQFDTYSTSEYAHKLRAFLGMPRLGFAKAAGLIPKGSTPKMGRQQRYPVETIRALEDAVNAKSARGEAANSSLGERYKLARDYLGLSDAGVARAVGVSRELARRWKEDIHRPSCLQALSQLLEVPESWLEFGGEERLPANSTIGVRVGQENREWRERLYAMTLRVVSKLPDEANVGCIQAAIENAVFSQFEMAQAARRAGGRWQSVGSSLLFAPWVPIAEHGLSRRFWSDDVETIIQDELATKSSIYSAWHALRGRCLAKGLTPADFPRLISLQKRIAKEKWRTERYGVDLNDLIAKACNCSSDTIH